MKSNYLQKINAWDEAAAKHILSRTLFGFNKDDVDFALSNTLDNFVDKYLLADHELPSPPGDWVNEAPSRDNFDQNGDRNKDLVNWWFDQILAQNYSFREKMVLFFHNHYVSEVVVVKWAQYMYMQNQLFRENAFGNLIELTKKVNIDPAMLIYLDGRNNNENKPNENYARELLELFTIGIGNYTETDIQEAARALTGWVVFGLGPLFIQNRHDEGEKTFLGETGNFNHEEIVDIIFSKDETANFLCRKLYANFIHYEPNEDYVSQLANVMRENNYEFKPVLSTMLKSEFFHSEEIRGAKIKSSIEFLVAPFREFNLSDPDYTYLRQGSTVLQQVLFNPPDVKGWEGQRKWISTTTYPYRNIYTDSIVTGTKYPQGNLSHKIDAIEFARSFESSEKADKFVEEVTNQILQFPLSQSKKDLLLEIMLDGSDIYDWSTYDPQAETRLKGFFQALLRLPEYQLA